MIKIIKDFSRYTIDHEGNVKNIKCGNVMSHNLCRVGYHRVHLIDDNGKRKAVSVHRLVASHFVRGRSKTKKEVNHIDGNKSNNHYSNLEWCTRKHNMLHARRVLKRKFGNPEKVLKNKAVKFLHANGWRVYDISIIFETSEPNIQRILKR